RSALEQQCPTRSRERRAHLIHDAAAHADVIVLGTKRHACQLAGLEAGAPEQAERLGRGHRERGGRCKARGDWHLARHRDASPALQGSRAEGDELVHHPREVRGEDRKSTRLNSSHVAISYAVFCLKKKNIHGAVPSWLSCATSCF